MQRTTPEEWFLIAREDLTAARILLRDGTALRPAFFLAQQAAEKALKGYQVFKGSPIARTHDLVLLLLQCTKFEAQFSIFKTHAIKLNNYQTQMRYPDDPWAFPDEEALHTAIERAGAIFNFIIRQITPSK